MKIKLKPKNNWDFVTLCVCRDSTWRDYPSTLFLRHFSHKVGSNVNARLFYGILCHNLMQEPTAQPLLFLSKFTFVFLHNHLWHWKHSLIHETHWGKNSIFVQKLSKINNWKKERKENWNYSFWSLRLIMLAAEQLTPSSLRR